MSTNQFGCGILSGWVLKSKIFSQESTNLKEKKNPSMSAKIALSKSIFDVKDCPNF